MDRTKLLQRVPIMVGRQLQRILDRSWMYFHVKNFAKENLFTAHCVSRHVSVMFTSQTRAKDLLLVALLCVCLPFSD